MSETPRRYRPQSIRLPHWDYTSGAWYFVTICVGGGVRALGSVEAPAMRLSPLGEIIADEWLATPRIRPTVRLDEWVVMPNHLHGILILDPDSPVETPRRGVYPRPATTRPVDSTRRTPRLQPNSLGSIIGQFKGACTRRIREAGPADFEWQSRFYDRVIRNERELDRIRAYIRDNPLRWDLEKNNPAGPFM